MADRAPRFDRGQRCLQTVITLSRARWHPVDVKGILCRLFERKVILTAAAIAVKNSLITQALSSVQAPIAIKPMPAT
jgi:hypothetical protein